MAGTPERFGRTAAWAGVLMIVGLATPPAAQDATPEDGEIELELPAVEVEPAQVQVRPDLDVVLPDGVIRQRASLLMGDLRIDTRADFDIPQSSVAGEIRLRRPIGRWTPRFSGFQSSASESLARPRIEDDEIALFPDDRFFRRERGITAGLRLRALERVALDFGASMTETIEDLLADDEAEAIRREDFIVEPTASIEIGSLRIPRPFDSADIEGSYLRLALTQRYNGSLQRPVSLRGRISTLLHQSFRHGFAVEHQINARIPFVIQDRSRFSPLVLGGYESVRGYSPSSLAQVRGIAFRNTFTWRPGGEPDATVSPALPGNNGRLRLRLHSPRALAALDAAFGQETIAIDGPLATALSAGPGFSMVLTAGGAIHLDFRGMLVWPLEPGSTPVGYIQVSITTVS